MLFEILDSMNKISLSKNESFLWTESFQLKSNTKFSYENDYFLYEMLVFLMKINLFLLKQLIFWYTILFKETNSHFCLMKWKLFLLTMQVFSIIDTFFINIAKFVACLIDTFDFLYQKQIVFFLKCKLFL